MQLPPLWAGVGKLVGKCHSFTGSLCPAIGDFELCVVTSKLQKVPILMDIPRGGVFAYFPTPSHPPPLPIMGGVGHTIDSCRIKHGGNNFNPPKALAPPYAPINIRPHSPLDGQGWGLVGELSAFDLKNRPKGWGI